MEQRNDDLSGDSEKLPQPGTQEPTGSSGTEGDAGSGPGNVTVDEPTAGALDADAGSPGGGAKENPSEDSDDEASEDSDGEASEDSDGEASEDSDDESSGDSSSDDADAGDGS